MTFLTEIPLLTPDSAELSSEQDNYSSMMNLRLEEIVFTFLFLSSVEWSASVLHISEQRTGVPGPFTVFFKNSVVHPETAGDLPREVYFPRMDSASNLSCCTLLGFGKSQPYARFSEICRY